MSPEPSDQRLVAIVAELRVVRERGLVRLRYADLPEIRSAAARSGVMASAQGGSAAVEALLRAAVTNLGEGSLGSAAAATFGLGRRGRDRPAQDRRRQAALVYGVSVERFRKHHERIVLEQVAEEILKLDMTNYSARETVTRFEFVQHLHLQAWVGGQAVPVTVHIEPVELLSGVDIVVAPTNLYLELPQHYKSSISAALRSAGAMKGADGQIVADTIADELRAWSMKHSRPGLPIAPGTVAVTSAGEMASQGVRRIYHVAVAMPRPGTNDYEVDPTAIARGARNSLRIAREERALFEPELASIGFPLIGAGRGGLHPAASFAWLWSAIERDTEEHGPWDVHFITRRRAVADVILAKLVEAGATDGADQFL